MPESDDAGKTAKKAAVQLRFARQRPFVDGRELFSPRSIEDAASSFIHGRRKLF